ncbi:hypothetical protein RI129_009098 [Pyrocoelia pectoralis]|uniref:MADF domain-containing protein n=1 Tax=Pyrocoelia pectoralis TaxID=417401 RepID=A0AAN7VD72_9COLE
MPSFEEKMNLKLVAEVEKFPILYNYKLDGYSKCDSVDAAWENIAKEMKDTVKVTKWKMEWNVWPLLGDCFLQTVQLLKVQFRVKSVVVGEQLIVDDSLPIPPNTRHVNLRLATVSTGSPRFDHDRFRHVMSRDTFRRKNPQLYRLYSDPKWESRPKTLPS